MIKTIFKLLLCIFVYTIVFMVASAIMPFSKNFGSSDPNGMLFMLITCAWSCFTMYFIIKHSNFSSKKLFFDVILIMFFIQFFMAQIETLFFGDAFSALTKLDIILIMLVGFFPLSATAPLLIKFFHNKNAVAVKNEIDIKSILIKLGIIGIIYLFVYMLFGYFVAWQFEEVRLFYTGSTEKLGFLGQLVNNMRTNSIIYPFQILRGILFGIIIIPLKNMFNKKHIFIISICLAYLCIIVQIIIPSSFLPTIVRMAHLLEVGSSMIVFGIIVGYILWYKQKTSA